MNYPHNTKGISVIEILVVLVIIGIITGLALPRFQDRNTANEFKKDTALFVENVGKAQALAASGNSQSCAVTVNEKLDHVDLKLLNSTTYQIIPICIITSVPTINTPTPNPSYVMTYTMQFSELSCTTMPCVVASFFPDSTVTPGETVTFTGAQTCTISVSSTGLITNTCPQ